MGSKTKEFDNFDRTMPGALPLRSSQGWDTVLPTEMVLTSELFIVVTGRIAPTLSQKARKEGTPTLLVVSTRSEPGTPALSLTRLFQ
jgi:hypothetical protein